jgi:hypothetical protein
MIKKFALTIVITFSIIGFFVTATALHEISHYYDFKDISQESEICALNIPTEIPNLKEFNTGYYKFTPTPNSQEIYKQKMKYTELKSYSLEFILLFIMVLCIFIVLKKGL